MFGDGAVIGLNNKVRKYKTLVEKLIKGQKLTAEDEAFLEKEGITKAEI